MAPDAAELLGGPMTDRPDIEGIRAHHLEALAQAARRKNQPRRFRVPWHEAINIPSASESAFMAAASPGVVLSLIKLARKKGKP